MPDCVGALMSFRPLRPEDAPHLVRFYNQDCASDRDYFSPYGDSIDEQEANRFADEFAQGKREDIVAVHGERVVGWGFLEWKKECRPRELSLGIAVAPDAQHRGFARCIVAHLESRARKRGLESIRLIVVAENQKARNLYRSCGFVDVEEFTHPNDGLQYIAMRKAL